MGCFACDKKLSKEYKDDVKRYVRNYMKDFVYTQFLTNFIIGIGLLSCFLFSILFIALALQFVLLGGINNVNGKLKSAVLFFACPSAVYCYLYFHSPYRWFIDMFTLSYTLEYKLKM